LLVQKLFFQKKYLRTVLLLKRIISL